MSMADDVTIATHVVRVSLWRLWKANCLTCGWTGIGWYGEHNAQHDAEKHRRETREIS